jgi:HEAT repeat protein
MNITTYTKRQSEVISHRAVLNNKNSNRQGTGVLKKRGESRDEDRLIAMLKDQDSNVRKAAVQALGKKGNTLVIDSLISALKDEDINVREAAAEALGKIGDSRAVEPLISAMLFSVMYDRKMNISAEMAVKALVEINQPAIDPLMSVLQSQSRNLIYVGDEGGKTIMSAHQGIMKVLTNIGHPALDFLISALKVKNWEVQQKASEALGKIGDKRAIDPLIEALEDKNVQREAVEALGKLRASRAVEPLIAMLKVQRINDFDNDIVVALTDIGQPAVDHLIAGLKDINRSVRSGVAKALGEIKDKRAIDPLIEVAIYDNDFWVRETAAKALDKLEDDGIVGYFITLLTNEDSKVRKMAAEALREIKDSRAIDPLIVGLQDRENGVRKASAEALGKIGDSRAVDFLIAVLKDEDGNVRKAVTEALREIGDSRAIDSLIARLDDEDTGVRKAAAEALREIGDSRAIDSLITALKDKDSNVREAVAETLGKLGDSRAVEPLITVLQDEDNEDWKVKQTVAWALGKIGDSRAVEPLISALNMYGETAAVALLRIGKPAIKHLITVLQDRNSEVRKLAAQILDKLAWQFSNEEERISYHIAKGNWDECVQIGKPAVVPLIEVLKEHTGLYDQREIMFGAARALVELQDKRAVDPLITILNDKKGASLPIIWVLGEMREPHAVESLISLMKDGTSDIRKAVAWALGVIGDKRAIPSLVLALQDWKAQKNWEVGNRDWTTLTKTGLDPFWRDSKWPVLMTEGPIVWALEKLRWEPQTMEEKIHFLVAKRDWKILRTSWDQTKDVLLKDVSSSEYLVIENAIAAFIGIGDETIIPDLINILERKSTITLAEAYLNSGHLQLENAAVSWGEKRGYHVKKGPGEYLATWGK